jgi:uncharacterized protein (UPF0276 family)
VRDDANAGRYAAARPFAVERASHLPVAAGIGLRAPHVAGVLAEQPPVSWFEVHSENYYVDGGHALSSLLRIRADYPLSLHGVGLSLGGTDPLDRSHLAKLARLVALAEPALVSEHLCWSSVGGRHLNDLLPLPFNEAALAHTCARIQAVQESLRHPIAVENISSYVTFAESTIAEPDFVAEVVQRTGCHLLLDVNNVYVNAVNHGFDADAYVARMPADAIAELHVAGFEAGAGCLIDTHGAPVAAPVWALYARTIARIGTRPTLIEWDTNLPPFATLEAEAAKAHAILAQGDVVAA